MDPLTLMLIATAVSGGLPPLMKGLGIDLGKGGPGDKAARSSIRSAAGRSRQRSRSEGITGGMADQQMAAAVNPLEERFADYKTRRGEAANQRFASSLGQMMQMFGMYSALKGAGTGAATSAVKSGGSTFGVEGGKNAGNIAKAGPMTSSFGGNAGGLLSGGAPQGDTLKQLQMLINVANMVNGPTTPPGGAASSQPMPGFQLDTTVGSGQPPPALFGGAYDAYGNQRQTR